MCTAIADLSHDTSRLRVRKTIAPKITAAAATTRLMASEPPAAMTDHTGMRLIPRGKDILTMATTTTADHSQN